MLVNSLVLLGISPAQASREYGCEIHAAMFAQPNQKGLNTILHLIFDHIKGREHLRKVPLNTPSRRSGSNVSCVDS